MQINSGIEHFYSCVCENQDKNTLLKSLNAELHTHLTLKHMDKSSSMIGQTSVDKLTQLKVRLNPNMSFYHPWLFKKKHWHRSPVSLIATSVQLPISTVLLSHQRRLCVASFSSHSLLWQLAERKDPAGHHHVTQMWPCLFACFVSLDACFNKLTRTGQRKAWPWRLSRSETSRSQQISVSYTGLSSEIHEVVMAHRINKWILLNMLSEGKQIKANSLWSAHNNRFYTHHGQHVTHFPPRASGQWCSLLHNRA